MTESPLVDSRFVVLVFSPRDDLIACLNKAMVFLTAVASLRNTAWYKEKEALAKAQEAGQILDEEKLAFLIDPGVSDNQAIQTIIPNNAAFHTKDLDTYDSDCDDILNAKLVLMANISNYGLTLSQSREKMIDSQMDDMIKEKLALKEQVDSLEQNLSK
nr:hypothetical protein [Tanacetum cinerariifolium]